LSRVAPRSSAYFQIIRAPGPSSPVRLFVTSETNARSRFGRILGECLGGSLHFLEIRNEINAGSVAAATSRRDFSCSPPLQVHGVQALTYLKNVRVCVCTYKTEQRVLPWIPPFFSCRPECRGEMPLCSSALPPTRPPARPPTCSPFLVVQIPCRISYSGRGIVLREIPDRERGFFVGTRLLLSARDRYQC